MENEISVERNTNTMNISLPEIEELKKTNQIYQLILEKSTELFSLIDRNGMLHYISPSFKNLLEYDITLSNQKNLLDKVHPDDQAFVKKEILSYCNRTLKKTLKLEFRIFHNKGHYISVEAEIVWINEQTISKDDIMLIVMRDIHDRQEAEQAIYRLAFFDPLTNLPNRRSFMNKLQNEIIESKLSGLKFTTLLININDFKLINEEWGHEIGDLVLKETANTIQSAVQQNGEAAHFGGDEFVVLLKNIENEQDLMKRLQDLLEKFESPLIIEGREYKITVGVGVVNYPEHGGSPEDLIKNADIAQRHIKENEKNDFMIFDQTIENQSLERRLLESALRKGISKQQFYLEYQPKMNMTTNVLYGMEALVRWKHPDLGIIPPGKFISVAEETGLIVPLGEWILRESCRQTKQWQDAGYPQLVVSVNVSVRQLADLKFMDKLEAILNETKLDPKWLELEVTESVLADVDRIVSILKEIRKRGIQISIDDFGTGYSSLSYIKELPIDTLKVDQSFVKDIHSNEESKAIAQVILNLANSMGLNVIAEGVELQEHVEELSKGGYILGQGYYFSRPLKVGAFEQFIDEQLKIKK